ncbi:MAG: 30S ribosomal protein S1 [Anaerolineae bacterium]|jgi:small subunit ribosomal protein S1|nr:S1 RNA-binding domain-containing protein [Chloroflexota bacterium]
MVSYSLDSLAVFLQRARERHRAASLSGALLSVDTSGVPCEPGPGQVWDALEGLLACGQPVQALVTGWNRGGLLVSFWDVQGFVPASQLADVPLLPDDMARAEALSQWVGQYLTLKVIEVDATRRRLVFSERAAAWAPRQGEELLDQLAVGDIREGTVSNICNFGAFVDLGGIDGLIHISEISWGRVTQPAAFLQLGETVRVLVLSIDREAHHIGLSIKRLYPNPWETAEERYRVGEVVEAEVTNLVDFGAFVQLAPGLEGLVHISEMADEHVEHPSCMLQIGDRVRVRVLYIEKEHHRLSLSLRQCDAAQGGEDPAPFAADTRRGDD